MSDDEDIEHCSLAFLSNSSDCSDSMVGASKSKSVAGKKSSAPAGLPLIDWFFRPAMLFQFSLVAGLFALWPYAIQRLPSLDKRPEYRLTFSQIQIQPPPDRPVPLNLLEQVRQLADLPDEFSILDENLTTEVARAFRRHPWVAKVARVRKKFPSAVTVELEYRNPVAMVRQADKLTPIDLQGVALPISDFSTEEASRYPVIQNPGVKVSVQTGSAWDDPAILAAAQLASYLKDKWTPLKLEAITVDRSDASKTLWKDLSLVLIGRGGSRILWGRAPGIDYPGELEPTQKIRRIEKYLADFGDYVRPSGPYEIDIRHWHEISRHALVVAPTSTKPVKSPKDEARRPNPEPRRKSRS